VESDSARFTYVEAARYLESLELFGMHLGLERMRRLMTALDSPQGRFRAVQVVGTNGKSSTARMTAAILARHGVRTGAYLSPHLTSWRERIQIDGGWLSEERFATAIRKAARAAQLVERRLPSGERVTQFEALTAGAYWELARSGVDAAVIEAGLGARFDATSVAHPDVLVLTGVSLEHTRWLGPTERHIAEEKLAVVPPGGTLVAGPLTPEPLAVAERNVRERDATFVYAGRDLLLEELGESFAVTSPAQRYGELLLRVRGRFQRLNFALAVGAAEAMIGELNAGAVREAARAVRLPGRLEVVSEDPLLVFDGAHNPEAAAAVRPELEELARGRRLVAVVSVLDDKDAAGILSVLLPACTNAVFTRSRHPRALPPATLESLSRQLSGPPGEVVVEPAAAVARARVLAGDGAVVVLGSIYLLSELVQNGASEQVA
jgi:dihydrofolate synthase / folylpolyglutamate synthase